MQNTRQVMSSPKKTFFVQNVTEAESNIMTLRKYFSLAKVSEPTDVTTIYILIDFLGETIRKIILNNLLIRR